jgi:hypothetical protein
MSLLALDADLSAVRPHQFPRNRESQTGAARPTRTGLVHAVEALEHAGQVLGRDTGAGVRHRDHRCGAVLHRGHSDLTARRRGAAGVLHQDQERLMELVRVSGHPEAGRRRGADLHALRR